MLYCPRLGGADDESRAPHIDQEADGSDSCNQTTREIVLNSTLGYLDYVLWDFVFWHFFLVLLHNLYHIGIIIAAIMRKYVQNNAKDDSQEDDQ